MKLCPNCHRLSKDEDFCSYCGSAVYDDNTGSSIDCSQIKGHTHEKQTFSEKDVYRYGRDNVSVRPEPSANAPKKKNGFLKFVIILIVINVVADMFFGGLSGLFEFLEMLLDEI